MDPSNHIYQLVKEKKWLEAYTYIETTDLNSTKDPALLQLIAHVYKENYRWSDAFTAIKRAFMFGANNYTVALEYAYMAISVNNQNSAKMAVDRLVSLQPDSLETYKCCYAYEKSFVGNVSTMINLLEKICDMEYDEHFAIDLAQIYFENDNVEKCKQECIRIKNYFRSGEIVREAKRLLEAIRYMNRSHEEEKPPDKSNSFSINNQPQSIGEEPKATFQLPPEIEREFDNLVGMESIKQPIYSFINEAKLDQERAKAGIQTDTKKAYHFMLLGNPGTGKTEVARILARILFMLRIRNSDNLVEVDRSGLLGEYIGHTEKRTQDVIESAQGGTLFIDEAYTLYKKDSDRDFGKEALDVLMKAMWDKQDSFSVILAGYKNRMIEMLDSNPGLKGRISHTIEIQDYSEEDLLKIGDKIAEGMKLILTSDGKQALLARIRKEKVDETFANARFVRNEILEAYRQLANRLAGTQHTNEDMFKLKAVDFGISMTATPEQVIEDTLKELKSMIGLAGVKNHVETIINSKRIQMEMVRRGLTKKGEDLGTLHMVFSGSPGTGKTTVARLIGRIYEALGILKRGDVFIECTSRADLVAAYQGQTAIKTKEVIKRAMGGILFIDEAYALVHGENDSFGREAIDTLIAEMENNRDKLMVIFGGYKSDMARFVEENPGMTSRISNTIEFEDYSLDELVSIFKSMCSERNLILDDKVEHKVRNAINKEMQNKLFGNARGVRNIVERTIRRQNTRLVNEQAKGKALKDSDLLLILAEDVT